MSCSKVRLTLPCLLLYRGFAMTEIHFSKSLSLANDFGVKLLSGMLNMRIDYSAEGCPFVEATRTTEHFTTECMADFRAARYGSLVAVLEASDPEYDPDSNYGLGEIRHIVLYTRDPDSGTKRKRATFDLFRDYLD